MLYRTCNIKANPVLNDAMDKGLLPATIFVDIKKAFDSISHKILLSKLHNCGGIGQASLQIQSYLKDRKQIFDANGYISDEENLSNAVGVPQGSILGPPSVGPYNTRCPLSKLPVPFIVSERSRFSPKNVITNYWNT